MATGKHEQNCDLTIASSKSTCTLASSSIATTTTLCKQTKYRKFFYYYVLLLLSSLKQPFNKKWNNQDVAARHLLSTSQEALPLVLVVILLQANPLVPLNYIFLVSPS